MLSATELIWALLFHNFSNFTPPENAVLVAEVTSGSRRVTVLGGGEGGGGLCGVELCMFCLGFVCFAGGPWH